MAHPNQNMRDPIMYRILHARHYRTGDAWCVYPSYDWAHGLEDSIEGITHSLCSIEFENHRPLYDWFLDRLGIYHPRQIEFGRLNLANTVMSKRKILGLVREGCVRDFDDPRLHTLRALRRRGYTPEGIQNFLGLIGISKTTATAEVAMLEHGLREDLNKRSPRVMAVLRPLKVVIDNYPEGKVEELDAVNNPEDAAAGTRKVPFSRVIYIEQDDFMEEPPAKFYRLAPGREVRLRYAYFVTCARVVKDAAGRVVELHCTYDPATRGGDSPDGRKVKATLHWVSAARALDAEVRLYDQLLRDEKGEAEEVEAPQDDAAAATQEAEWKGRVNPDSLQVLTGCKVEPSVADKTAGWRCQFERLGYFCMDPDSAPGRPVFNRAATLKDEWLRIQKREGR
jgi:glutaminyl-tRNA synthetase